MKTNEFKVKKINKKNIVLEEKDKKKRSPFFGFFAKYGIYVYLGLLTFSLSIFMLSMLLSLSKIGNSGNYEDAGVSLSLEFNNNSTTNPGTTGTLDQIIINNLHPITEETALLVFNNKYGNIIKKDSYVIVTNTTTLGSNTIYYFSDGTCIVRTQNEIYKVASLANYTYGVEINNNNIIFNGKRMLITLTSTTTLTDGTILNYYSDNTVLITKNNITALLRDKDNLIKNNDNNISYLLPSIITYQSNNNVSSNITIVNTITTSNNFIITYYSDGSAIINYNNKYIKVKKSKDIIINNNYFIEITTNKTITKIYTDIVNNTKINYFDDGSALVEYSDTNKKYTEDSTNIEINNNIVIINGGYTNTTDINILPDTTKVINLDNDLTVIIAPDNSMKIVNTKDLYYDVYGNIKEIVIEELQDTDLAFANFTINNNIMTDINYRLVLEESSNQIPASNLRYHMIVGDTIVEPNYLDHTTNVWNQGSTLAGGTTLNKKSYILHEGTMAGGASYNVSLGLWINYETITNEYQDKSFIGTLRLYAWTDE